MPRLLHSRFQPARGGHAPGDVRTAFLDGIDTFMTLDDGEAMPLIEMRDRKITLHQLAGVLWNCSDTMPGATCRQLHDLALRVTEDSDPWWRGGQSYAQGARLVRLYLRVTERAAA